MPNTNPPSPPSSPPAGSPPPIPPGGAYPGPPAAAPGHPQPVLPYSGPANYGPPYGHPYGSPYGPPMPPPPDPRAETLVRWSRILGWGGAALFLVGPIIAGMARRFEGTQVIVGFAICGIGLAAAIGGAVVGQIGRAMQGRVI